MGIASLARGNPVIVWGRSATILIADDVPEQVNLITRVLAVEGYQCIAASDGRGAIEACLSQKVDVALLDMNMPFCDGLAACRTLKGSPETALIPVLVMTGQSDASTHLSALEAGADDFVPKPICFAELRARVRSAVRMKRCTDELDNAAASIVMLGAAIEARDPRTKGHCERLARYATTLGSRIGLDRRDVRALEQGGYLHDLGKVAIPDAVLFKAGPLTPAEYLLIQSHTTVGDRICVPLRTLRRARSIIRSHHELLDGTGYPDRLRGSAVPLLAQITGIVDVFDALVTERPYRAAIPVDAALETLRDEARAGKRDTALVEEFVGIAESTGFGALSPSTVDLIAV
jgi:cyclic di-GMP phosphodiesterase